MSDKFGRSGFWRWLTSGGVGVALGVGLYGWLLQLPGGRSETSVLLGLAIVAAVSGFLLASAVVYRWMIDWLMGLPVGFRSAVLVSAMAVPGAFAVVLPVRLPLPLHDRAFEVVPAQGAGPHQEVWVLDARLDATPELFEGPTTRLAGGEPVSDDGWRPGPGWAKKDGAWVAQSLDAGPLRWEGRGSWRQVSVQFASHPWSGAAELRSGRNTARVQLTGDNAPARSATVSLELKGAPFLAWVAWVAAQWGLAGLILLMAVSVLDRWSSRRAPAPYRLGLALPFWGVMLLQSVYLAAFHPGLMSSDSVDQWQQGLGDPIIGSHPALHTLLHRVMAQTVGSPAGIVIVQQLAYAFLIALWARELARRAAPRWVLAVTVILLGGWVVPGIMLSTIWKDIPYSLGLFALTFAVFRQITSGGGWLDSRVHAAGTSIALVAAAILRHNGLIAGLFAVAALWRTSRRRKAVVLVAVSAAAMFGLIRGPLYRAIGVISPPAAFSLQNQVHQVAALIADGTQFDPDAEKKLAEIQPLSVWRDTYYCYSLNPSFYHERFDRNAFQEHSGVLLRSLLSGARANPKALWHRQLCVTAYLWRITPAQNSYLYTHASGIDPNKAGLAPAPLLPEVGRSLLGFADFTQESLSLRALFWGPAAWHYLVFLGVGLLALLQRNTRLLWIAAPVFGNMLSLLLLSPSQSMRYAFSAHLVGMLIPALLALPKSAAVTSRVEEEGQATAPIALASGRASALPSSAADERAAAPSVHR